MIVYWCFGLGYVGGDGDFKFNDVRDGSIIFSTRSGQTGYEDAVKFPNLSDQIYHDKVRNKLIELMSYSLFNSGVK